MLRLSICSRLVFLGLLLVDPKIAGRDLVGREFNARGGIKTVLITDDNVKDLQDIPENVKNGLEIVPVKWIDKVLEVALEKMPQALPEEEAVAVPAPVAADAKVEAKEGAVKH